MLVLETARLVLHRLTPEDAGFILELLNDPLFLRFVGDKGVRTLEDAREYIRHGPMASYDRHGFGLFLVRVKAGATPVGICGLLRRDGMADVEIGFGFLARHAGLGYATEAAAAMLLHGRTVHGLQRLVAITAPDNAGSIHVLEKIGLAPAQLIRLPAYPGEQLLFTSGG